MPASQLEELIQNYKNYAPQGDVELLRKAYEFSEHSHQTQKRASQEPYFVHCLEVAKILIDFKLDIETICAGLLHDVLEDTDVNVGQLDRSFGGEITSLVDGVTKLERLQFQSFDEFQAENWRKMLLAMAKDIRVILIKLADRLHNMRTLQFLSAEDQKRIAQETLTLYAPIAERLGMFRVKSELEDLAFKTLEPETFKEIETAIERGHSSRADYLKGIVAMLETKLSAAQIPCRLTLRAKNVYSIYRKMLRQKKSIDQIEDVMGIRVITDTLASCYGTLGEVHSTLRPVPGSFTDYIAHPKPNLYQSLHTTVYGPEEKPVEVQIRTEQMQKRSEHGVAAHWKYKLGFGPKGEDKHLETQINWLREWLEWLQDLKNPREFLESLATELKMHQIFVFTPQRQVKALPEGSSPVDFAYAVHTDIGNTCVGAKVNNKMVRLDEPLESGDTCEILTRKNAKPNKDWLVFVKTARARSRIRRTLKSLETR